MTYTLVLFLAFSASAQIPTPLPADFNRDGIVDGEDLLILRRQWGRELPFTPSPTESPTHTPTPEPTGTPGPLPSEITINLPDLAPGARPLQMVLIAAGAFLMGSSDSWATANEQPVHAVSLGYRFYIGKYEITQAQWLAVMGSWPGTAPSEINGLGNDYPAYYVSWNNCQGFIDALNQTGQGTFRLPSEAEWEYACRGSAANPHRYDRFYYGDSSCGQFCVPCDLDAYAWWCGNNYPNGTFGTKGTGQKIPNDLGLHDLHGNVWEWCLDYWHNGYDGAPGDGSPWLEPATSNRSIRGGAWNLDAPFNRSAYRSSDTPGKQASWIGFRIVQDTGQ